MAGDSTLGPQRGHCRQFRADRRCPNLGRCFRERCREPLDQSAGAGADPVCGLFPDQPDELVAYFIDSSRPTHASPQRQSAYAYLGLVLCGLIHRVDRQEVLAADWGPLASLRRAFPLHAEVEEVASGSFRQKQPPEIVGSGYVVKSLEAALWAFHDANDFREAVLRAVNLGDDADTTGAVCGQLAGAYWGEAGIPGEWLEGLARRDMIEPALRGLFRSAE